MKSGSTKRSSSTQAPDQCPRLPDRYAYPAFSDGLGRDPEYLRMRVKVDAVLLPDIRRSPMQRGQLAVLKGLRISDLHILAVGECLIRRLSPA